MRKPYLQPQEPSANSHRQIFSVSQLNQRAKALLESDLAQIWLEGEISNFVCAASGHWYFTLKDNDAQIKCALFKFKNRPLNISPQEGDKVLVKGKVSLYQARGDYQLIADYMEAAGLGQLQLKLNTLIRKLDAENLFLAENKKPLPFLPKTIGVITSPSGAAIHDVITVLERRCPMVSIIIYATPVQGKTAASNIISALKKAQQRNECDVILMTRGGGSLEDLWCFNNEKLAREISQCSIPIVAAIGHEVDVTITELVADLRAATPSAAAELLAPEQQTLWQKLDLCQQTLKTQIITKIQRSQNRLDIAFLKLKSPEHSLLKAAKELNFLSQKLREHFYLLFRSKKNQLNQLLQQLVYHHPKEKLARHAHRLQPLKNRLDATLYKKIQQHSNQLAIAANNLNAFSPLSTLNRGYSIIRDTKKRHLITKIEQIKEDQSISIHLTDGEVDCQVSRLLGQAPRLP